MSVERENAVIANEIILRINFRFAQTGDLFSPYAISKVEILDSDAETVLETISGASIINDSLGKYHVVAAAIATPKTIYDKWYFTPAVGATEITRTNTCVVWEVAGAGAVNKILTKPEYKDIVRDKMGLDDTALPDATIEREDGVTLAEKKVINRLVAADLVYTTILEGEDALFLRMAAIYCICALLSKDDAQGKIKSEKLPDYQYENFKIDRGKRENDFWDKVDENLCSITGYTITKKLIDVIEGTEETTEESSGSSSPY